MNFDFGKQQNATNESPNWKGKIWPRALVNNVIKRQDEGRASSDGDFYDHKQEVASSYNANKAKLLTLDSLSTMYQPSAKLVVVLR